MANMTNDLSNKANGAASDFKNKIQNTEHQIERMAQPAGQSIGSMTSEFASSAAETMKMSRDHVKANPVKGVAIAAAAGLVTGSLLSIIFRGRKS